VDVRCPPDARRLTLGSFGVAVERRRRGGEDENARECSDREDREQSQRETALPNSRRWSELLERINEARGGERERVFHEIDDRFEVHATSRWR
jgi:hypothetical protein